MRGYDYSQPGAYFVTIVTQERECVFGEITDGEMHLNPAGQMIATAWGDLPVQFAFVQMDAFVVMPNHLHGIIVLTGEDVGHNGRGESRLVSSTRRGIRPGGVGGDDGLGDHEDRPYDVGGDSNRHQLGDHPVVSGANGKDRPYDVGRDAGDRPRGTLPGTVGRIVQGFKSITTHEYIVGVKEDGWTPIRGRLWQRNYYEHVVRGEDDLQRIRQYIAGNPQGWALDRENPANMRARG
jgi:REP element-mobilizing transposase RayT